jgi:SagB-type dehydrogenase family enzyme
MRHLVITFCTLLFIGCLHAQDLKVIKLSPPAKTGGEPLMKVFNDRKSDRAFAPDKLKLQELSTLLWAANGINREDGKRTAPSAMNVQDVDVYVVMEEGAYLYDAKQHALQPVAPGDHRGAVAGGQDFVKSAPVSLVLVSDLSRLSKNNIDEGTKLMGAVDVGIVCQNINIACAGMGLATVPRASMNKETLKTVLKLTDNHLLLMNNPVGYPKK